MTRRRTRQPKQNAVSVEPLDLAYVLVAAEISIASDDEVYGPPIDAAWCALSATAPEVAQAAILAVEGSLPIRAGQLQPAIAAQRRQGSVTA